MTAARNVKENTPISAERDMLGHTLGDNNSMDFNFSNSFLFSVCESLHSALLSM